MQEEGAALKPRALQLAGGLERPKTAEMTAGRQVQLVLEEAGVCCYAGGFGNFSPPPSVSFCHPNPQNTHLKAPPTLHASVLPPWPPKHQHPILEVSAGEGAPARPVLFNPRARHTVTFIFLYPECLVKCPATHMKG